MAISEPPVMNLKWAFAITKMRKTGYNVTVPTANKAAHLCSTISVSAGTPATVCKRLRRLPYISMIVWSGAAGCSHQGCATKTSTRNEPVIGTELRERRGMAVRTAPRYGYRV